MSDLAWMIYGANGYTGRLVAEQVAREGKRPVLAGRREAAVRPLAEKLGLPWRAFSLESLKETAQGIKEVDLVLHCAGPFSATSAPMLEACLKTGTHYLDITGEIDVFEAIHARAGEARAAGAVLMPGVGFDVVPSDCLAASLARELPGATHLELAFAGLGKASPGTTKTMVEMAPKGGMIRREGRLTHVPVADKTKEIPFSDKPRWALSIPWGDVSTAYYSTGIPNIRVYMAMPRSLISLARFSRPLLPFLALAPVQRFFKDQVGRRVKGPDLGERTRGRVHLWAQVRDGSGRRVEGTLDVPEGYRFTAAAALACAERVLAGEVPAGAWTPSRAFGADFATRLPETKMRILGALGT